MQSPTNPAQDLGCGLFRSPTTPFLSASVPVICLAYGSVKNPKPNPATTIKQGLVLCIKRSCSGTLCRGSVRRLCTQFWDQSQAWPLGRSTFASEHLITISIAFAQLANAVKNCGNHISGTSARVGKFVGITFPNPVVICVQAWSILGAIVV